MSKGKKSIKKSERNNPIRKSIRIRKTKTSPPIQGDHSGSQ